MKTITILLALALTGCATTEYESYAKAQGDIARAKSDADTARYQALSKIAENGTDSAKVAAVMALALGGGSQSQSVQQVQAPTANTALQWASILVPGITQVAGIAANMRVGLAQSDNSAKVAVSTNETFVGLSRMIQAPGAITTTTTNTDRHDTVTTTDRHDVVTTDRHDVVTPAPVVIAPAVPVVIAPAAPIITPLVQVTPIVQITPITPAK